MSDLAIAIIAGFNWLNHCAVLAGADRDKFSGTLSNFRKVTGLARQWWAMEGAGERCSQMLAEGEKPPLMLYLIWTEYTRLAKEVAAAAFFGVSIERAIAGTARILNRNLPGAPTSSTPPSRNLRKPWPVSSAPAIPTILDQLEHDRFE